MCLRFSVRRHCSQLSPRASPTHRSPRFSLQHFLVRWCLPAGLLALVIFVTICRTDVHFQVYLKTWLSPNNPQPMIPLSNTCFPQLDANTEQTPRLHHYTFMTGHRTDYESTCYDLAATVRYLPNNVTATLTGETLFHTFWSRQLGAFSDAQLATAQSFVATQDTNRTQLVFWVRPEEEVELTASPHWKTASMHTQVTYNVIDWQALSEGTELQGANPERTLEDQLLLLRLLTLYQHGGVWFDAQTLFVRDLSPLLESEWMAQGSCFTSRKGNPFQGSSFLHFRQKSPYLCELIKDAASALESGHSGKDALGDGLYNRIYRRILHNHVKPWGILPWCFTEPSQCTSSISFQSPFDSHVHFNKRWLDSIFAFHWHDRPHSYSKQGSILQYLKSRQAR